MPDHTCCSCGEVVEGRWPVCSFPGCGHMVHHNPECIRWMWIGGSYLAVGKHHTKEELAQIQAQSEDPPRQ